VPQDQGEEFTILVMFGIQARSKMLVKIKHGTADPVANFQENQLVDVVLVRYFPLKLFTKTKAEEIQLVTNNHNQIIAKWKTQNFNVPQDQGEEFTIVELFGIQTRSKMLVKIRHGTAHPVAYVQENQLINVIKIWEEIE